MKKKSIIALVCVLALALGSMFGTLAYLTDTETAANVFTVGKVGITLDEANTDKDKVDGAIPERDTSNDYHLIPGQTYPKDPTIHVNADSEDCWLFVKVENGIAAIEADTEPEGTTDRYLEIEDQLKANGWNLLPGKTNIYTRTSPASAGDNIVVFSEFKIDGSGVNNTYRAQYANADITVTAYAIQAAGFADAASAWTAGNWK